MVPWLSKDRIRRLRHWVPVLSLWAGMAVVYGAVASQALGGRDGPWWAAAGAGYNALALLLIVSLLRTMLSDPGRVPPSWQVAQAGDRPPLHTVERKRDHSYRVCSRTLPPTYKPDRAHYDARLSRLVLRMDHHCPWVANAVGAANHKWFLLSVAYGTLLALLSAGLLLPEVVRLVRAGLEPTPSLLLTLAAFTLCAAVAPSLVAFASLHAWLLAHNLTTIEWLEKRHALGGAAGRRSPYDLGPWANVCAVLGPNPWLWPLPVGGPGGPDHGLTFPTAPGVTDAPGGIWGEGTTGRPGGGGGGTPMV